MTTTKQHSITQIAELVGIPYWRARSLLYRNCEPTKINEKYLYDGSVIELLKTLVAARKPYTKKRKAKSK